MVRPTSLDKAVQRAAEQMPLSGRKSVILLLGRSGSGKSYFIQTACPTNERINSSGLLERTLDVTSRSITIGSHEYEFIDPPGFVNIAMSNHEAFVKLANYLLHGTMYHQEITRIIYIYRAGDPLESNPLIQNASLLFDVLLGSSALSRLTVMVVPDQLEAEAPISIAQDLCNTDVFRAARAKGAEIIPATLHRSDIERIYLSDVSKPPCLLRIQQKFNQNPSQAGLIIGNEIQDRLASCEGIMLSSYKKDIQQLQLEANEREVQITAFSKIYDQHEQQLADNQEEITIVRRQLEQTRKEYAYLRTQLQLHENVEQGEIIQTLKDLNRSIDDLGRSISQHVIDTYATKVFGKDLGNVTTLNAHHLRELKMLFGHYGRRSSLVVSSSGKGMPAEDFLDYGVRSLLCKQLCNKIFAPFHPLIDPATNKTMAATYEDIQRQESQAVAARWRARCFKSIYKPPNDTSIAQRLSSITEEFLDDSLNPLMQYFFGYKAGVQAVRQHATSLKHIFQTAWHWNTSLKSEVIMLGDFHQTNFSPLSQFNPDSMEEFEANSHGPRPDTILATLGIGLTISHAIGGNQSPKSTVVVKAVVATKKLYA